MSTLHAVLLGVVEGITEFLPISSTAHLVLSSRLLDVPESAFLGSFIIAIQLGAIGAVVLLYWRTIFLDLRTLQRLAVAFVPTAIAGFFLYHVLKEYLLESLSIIAWALLLGGIAIIVFERWHGRQSEAAAASDLSYSNAFWIGCAQAVAIIPGVSRAGATILGGLALGVGRTKIVEFSFLLAIPTMLAATSYDLLKNSAAFAATDWQALAVGFVVSFVAAYVSVRWLLTYIQTHTFTVFGWYRIILGIGILGVLTLA